MQVDFDRYHVLVGSSATGEGEDVQAGDPKAKRYTGHYGIVAVEPAVVLVDGYFHDLRPARREHYSIRLSAGFGSYAGSDVDVSEAALPRQGGRPDQVNIPTLALYLPLRPAAQVMDTHWEQPDDQQPFDLQWDIFEVDEMPAFKLFLAHRVIPLSR